MLDQSEDESMFENIEDKSYVCDNANVPMSRRVDVLCK